MLPVSFVGQIKREEKPIHYSYILNIFINSQFSLRFLFVIRVILFLGGSFACQFNC